jgi:hypothetical protein
MDTYSQLAPGRSRRNRSRHLRALHLVPCAAALALCFFGATAHALTQHPPYPYGAPGDAGAVDGCEAGWYIVGFRVRSGLWFDSIGMICARRDATGYVDDKVVAMRGGLGGGAPANYRCNPNEVVIAINVWADDSARRVQHMEATCSAGPAFNAHIIKVSDVASSVGKGKHVQFQPCGAGEAAFALETRYGKDVNAAGLRCRPLEAPMAQQVPDPSVDIRSDDPPKAATQDFAGVWKVDTSNGATFDLTLSIVGKKVTGNFQILGQPQFNGTLSGTEITNGVIRFNWTQPQVPAGGEGSLEVFTNNTFRGFLNQGKPGLPLIKWTGSEHKIIHRTGKPRPSGGPAGGGDAPKATAVNATTVYKTHSGKNTAANKVCSMRPGDTGTVLSKGPDQWVDLSNISGTCAGKSGWVWNGGDLKLP